MIAEKSAEVVLGNARLFTKGKNLFERLELVAALGAAIEQEPEVTLERAGGLFLLRVHSAPASSSNQVVAVAFRARGDHQEALCDVFPGGLSNNALLASLEALPPPYVSVRVSKDCLAVPPDYQPSCRYGVAEVRLKNGSGIFDEVVLGEGRGCIFHVEQMDYDQYWIGVTPLGTSPEERLVVNLVAKDGLVSASWSQE